MLRLVPAVVLGCFAVVSTRAQFTLQQSGTDASLRGIYAISDTIAWASGTQGTVLHTQDGGAHWTHCAMPPGAEKLDFRGIQVFDIQTALVMSSGKGDLSRVYKTIDGCATWKLVFTNPDAPDGFFDAIQFSKRDEGWILGDPVQGHFFLATTQDGGETWLQSKADGLHATPSAGAFAASNQSLVLSSPGPIFGGGGGHLYRGVWPQCSQSTTYNDPSQCLDRIWFTPAVLPVGDSSPTAGIFAVAEHAGIMVAVGGDYATPESGLNTAAFSTDGGMTWRASVTAPHGYRSSVTYFPAANSWIAVGPNGTDRSTDDGRNWTALRPDARMGDLPDADRNWNALSLPFSVGPKGHIGKLHMSLLR